MVGEKCTRGEKRGDSCGESGSGGGDLVHAIFPSPSLLLATRAGWASKKSNLEKDCRFNLPFSETI